MARALRAKGCIVTGLDGLPADEVDGPDNYHQMQLGTGSLPVDPSTYDVVLLLDVIEHLKKPEDFINMLHDHLATSPETEIIATTGNVAFGPVRIMLLLGMFNYGKRGILDLDHARLFTFSSFRNIFTQRGFQVNELSGVPAPFHLALQTPWPAAILAFINNLGIRIWRRLFAFQIFIRLKPSPSLTWLLAQAEEQAKLEIRDNL